MTTQHLPRLWKSQMRLFQYTFLRTGNGTQPIQEESIISGVRFILQSLQCLQDSLSMGQLILRRGKAEEIIPSIAQEHGASTCYLEMGSLMKKPPLSKDCPGDSYKSMRRCDSLAPR